MEIQRKNRVAQWVYDTRSILGRFHLWLEDVEETWLRGEPAAEHSFVGSSLERAFIVSVAVTSLGTRLFGRYGEGKGLDKAGINRIKKDADAISAYALSEALWYLTRALPENHAVMISLGEGLMPKAGETPEMGSNPLLGFGRVYARPQVAHFLDRRVHRLLNDPGYEWRDFWREIQAAGITVWGGAVDTLENTSRFAKGAPTGALSVLHLFDQPLKVARPYEGYMGALTLPEAVVRQAAERSVLIDYLTPRELVLDAIRATYPGIEPDHVHVWTLGGPSREHRIGKLWRTWRELGVHLVEDGWTIPGTGMQAFNESGTYAPAYHVGPFTGPDGARNLFLCDGYAASAEAMQAASLDPILGNYTSMCLFSSKFTVPYDRERFIMQLDPESGDFAARLGQILERDATPAEIEEYRGIIRNARDAGMPVGRRTMTVDDLFPNKEWHVLALAGSMLPDPYSGTPGVEQVEPGVYRVSSRAATRKGILQVTLTLRLTEPLDTMRYVFLPLLDRFYAGQDYRTRAVKISDSGRIRNELETLASEALEYLADDRIRVDMDRVDDEVLSPDKKALILEVLRWYKTNHPIWFRWLEIG
ncbi:MAG: hypothetical protein GXP48_05765 [Acidobacteria bacterium]|nr:hypothetical protein [Acidobacteriota bacterium]